VRRPGVAVKTPPLASRPPLAQNRRVTSASGPGPSTFDASEREVLEWIAGGAPLGDVLESIVRLVEQQAPGMCCSILLLDREQHCVRYGAAPSLPVEFSRAIDGEPIGPEAGSCGTAAYLGQRVIVEDIAVHPYWAAYKQLALPHGLRACWSTPIFSTRREVLGTFAMYYREPRGPLPQELGWVDAATHLAAIAIGHEAAAQALRRSEAHYRRIADTAHEGIWLLDRTGRTLFANRRLAEILRCGPGELAGAAIFDFLDPAARPEVERKLAAPLGGAPEQHDVRLHCPDGTDVWAIVASSPVSDDDGRPVGTLAMVTDITERKEAEARIRRIARLYAVSSSVNEAIVRVRDTQELYERACRIAVEEGLLRLAWVGLYDEARRTLRPVARFGAADGYVDHITLSMDDALMNQGPAGRALRTGAWAVEDDIASASSFYWKDEALARGLRSCAAFPLTIHDRPVGVLLLYADRPGYFRDDELRVLGALADDIAFAVASAANEVERRRLVHDLGERVKELTLLHRTASLLQSDHPLDQTFLADLVTPIPRGWQYPEVCEARIACGDVEACTPGWRPTPWMQSVSFKAAGLQGVIEVAYLVEKPAAAEGPFLAEERALLQSLADMLGAHVDRQRTQAQLRQAQRVQSLGTLAGGIAHDFNNVLAAVGGNVELATRALPADHPAHKHLRRIEQATRRAADLVQRILAFSRQQEPRRAIVSLQSVVDEALTLLRATLPASIQIRTGFAAEAPRVRADASQLHQVIMNLGTNAAHAMRQHGGVLEVRIEPVALGVGAATIAPELREGRYVRLTVSDTGSGMDRATLEHIFEPFYTTKAPGHGTGLGLSVVHGILKSHDAAITVESQVGLGTTFHLYFPAADPTLMEAAPPPAGDIRGHGEHVLYVDDEEAVVYVATLILRGLGYRVTGSMDAAQALEHFRSRPGEFAAVVTDLAMPGLPGAELAQRVREIRPGIPVVLTSGYLRPEDAEAVERLGVVDVIIKANLVTDLGPTLHRLLTA
jgi:PAS domain S-box-containing protein